MQLKASDFKDVKPNANKEQHLIKTRKKIKLSMELLAILFDSKKGVWNSKRGYFPCC